MKHTSVSIGVVFVLLATHAMGEAPPDSDNDGVSDLTDQCVNEPGHVDSPVGTGCPCTMGTDTPDADCDGIPDAIDLDIDYGTGDSDGSGDTDDNGDNSYDNNDDPANGDGSNDGAGTDGADAGTGTGTGGGTGTGTGGGTGAVVDPWREYCTNTQGIWEPDVDWWKESGWCRYPGEVLGDCWVHVRQMPDHIRARYNLTDPGPFEHLFQYYARDRCRHRRGHWYPYW